MLSSANTTRMKVVVRCLQISLCIVCFAIVLAVVSYRRMMQGSSYPLVLSTPKNSLDSMATKARLWLRSPPAVLTVSERELGYGVTGAHFAKASEVNEMVVFEYRDGSDLEVSGTKIVVRLR